MKHANSACSATRQTGRWPLAQREDEKIKGYRRVDRIVHDFDGYDLVFRYYEREDGKVVVRDWVS